MLSRVANCLYWLGRYLERSENTARLVSVNDHLLLDLPSGSSTETNWQPLIDITGNRDLFRDLYGRKKETGEKDVLRFLLTDTAHPGSLLASLEATRENARILRSVLPREAWEVINEVTLEARDDHRLAVAARHRYHYLRQVVRGCQTMAGVLNGTMNHDESYVFLGLGRCVERADMTTRIVDVRSASLLREAPELQPFENIQWMSLLKSLAAYQMYRLRKQVGVRRADTLAFLLQDRVFPRSCVHCLDAARECIRALPRHDDALRHLRRNRKLVDSADIAALIEDPAELTAFLDTVQKGIAELHTHIAETWFRA